MNLMQKYLTVGVMVYFALLILCVPIGTAKESYDLEQGTSIFYNDFEKYEPSNKIQTENFADGFWTIRTKSWPRKLLNSGRRVPDLVSVPQLKGKFRIYVQIRCTNMDGTFGLKLSSEKDFQIIKPDRGTPDKHWDIEILWKDAVKMDGEKIIIRNIGDHVYLYGFRFVPLVEQKEGINVTDHVVIMQEKDKHFAFPGLCQAKSGDLLVVAREGKTHVSHGDYGKIVLSRSRDNGISWDKSVTIYEKPDRDLRDPSLICLKDGTILCSTSGGLLRSFDNGYNWEGPFPLPVFSPNGMAEGLDGYIYYVGLSKRGEILYTEIVRSKDKGKTWLKCNTIWLSKGYIPYDLDYLDEPNLFISNKCWIVTHRHEITDRNYSFIYQQFSYDNGLSWTWPKKTALWGYPAVVIAVPDNRLLCTYGYRRAPYGIRASISDDWGKTWAINQEIVIRKDGGGSKIVHNHDLGYPKSIVLDDGRIFIAYYLNTKDTNCYIAGSFLRLPGKKIFLNQ